MEDNHPIPGAPPPRPHPRPGLQAREEGAFGQRVVEAKHVLGTVLKTGVSSIN